MHIFEANFSIEVYLTKQYLKLITVTILLIKCIIIDFGSKHCIHFSIFSSGSSSPSVYFFLLGKYPCVIQHSISEVIFWF